MHLILTQREENIFSKPKLLQWNKQKRFHRKKIELTDIRSFCRKTQFGVCFKVQADCVIGG